MSRIYELYTGCMQYKQTLRCLSRNCWRPCQIALKFSGHKVYIVMNRRGALNTGDFHGYPTYVLENEHLRLELLQEAGPRIVRLIPTGGPNLLAELPDVHLPSPYGPYTLYGGHRLWHAPEDPARTYVPDDDGVTVHATPNGARMLLPADVHSHIAKIMEVELLGDDSSSDRLHATGGVRLQHTLRNEGRWPVQLAAWAITQLPPGGVAILPQSNTPLDDAGLLPNRRLNLWPYTRLSDPRLAPQEDFILIHGRADITPRFKIGVMNRQRWSAHLGQSYLFCKFTDPHPQQPHPDMGSNTEVYTDNRFLELETLSPLRSLAPGQELAHEEVWKIYPAPGVSSTAEEIRDYLLTLSL